MGEIFRHRYRHAGVGLDANVCGRVRDARAPAAALLIYRSLHLRLPSDRTPYWLEATRLAFGACLHAKQPQGLTGWWAGEAEVSQPSLRGRPEGEKSHRQDLWIDA
uniref:Uncharacterized protein n=1 Tax=Streptomyces sp. NBC_00003 TaxID=2903608 RepID=A0AAU2VFS2_9ACTN